MPNRERSRGRLIFHSSKKKRHGKIMLFEYNGQLMYFGVGRYMIWRWRSDPWWKWHSILNPG